MNNKQQIFLVNHGGFRIVCVFVLLGLSVIIIPVHIGHAATKEFSMQIQNQPLGAVLAELSRKSGDKIVCDEAWANLPITARFVQLPLEKAIRKILRNINHVVIYGPENIEIKIYGEAEPPTGSSKSTGSSTSTGSAPYPKWLQSIKQSVGKPRVPASSDDVPDHVGSAEVMEEPEEEIVEEKEGVEEIEESVKKKVRPKRKNREARNIIN